MSRRQSKAMTLIIMAASALALCLVTAYTGGRFPWMGLGYVSMALLAVWLLLMVLAGAAFTGEVLSRRMPVGRALVGIGLLVLLAIPVVHAFLPGPALNTLVSQRGFHQYLASQVPPEQLHEAVNALIANRRAEGQQSVVYGTKEKLATLPKAIRLLHPSGVVVDVPLDRVRIRWGRGVTSWQIAVTPDTIQVDDSGRD